MPLSSSKFLLHFGLAGALCVGAMACKNSPDTKDTAPDTQEPVATFTPDENQKVVMPEGFEDKKVPGSDKPMIKTEPVFSDAQRNEIMMALGCSEPLIRGSECQICPTIDPGVPMATPIKTGPNTPFHLMAGEYVKGKAHQVVAAIDNCTDAQGNLDITQVALLTRDTEEEPWKITASTTIPNAYQCEPADTTTTTTRTMCRVQRDGKHGLIHSFHGISWEKLAIEQSGELAKPMITPLVEVTEGAGCAENWSVEHEVVYMLKDGDGDGVLDLTFDVTTKEGAYVSPLDECMDGQFEAPLTPVRQLKESKTMLIYNPTPDGFAERDGKPYKPSLSEEYRTLLGKSHTSE